MAKGERGKDGLTHWEPSSVLRPSPSGLSDSSSSYDAILLLSFGGPEQPDDVMPFLENVVRGKNVPQERLLEVAKHYELFDGVSPINAHLRVPSLYPQFERYRFHHLHWR